MEEKQFDYDPKIYKSLDAEQILHLLFEDAKPQSVLDVGCGNGTWLKSLSLDFGVTNFLGLDNSIYDSKSFQIPPQNYLQVDLSKKTQLGKSFDWVFCLEVAEHLPSSSAQILIETLTSHSNKILFSAAIPGQGGIGHLNEQWPAYWQKLFKAKGFLVYDVLREKIWNNKLIEPWYKQNLFVAAIPNVLPPEWKPVMGDIRALVHPQIYQYKLDDIKYLSEVKRNSVYYPNFSFAMKTIIKALFMTPFSKKS